MMGKDGKILFTLMVVLIPAIVITFYSKMYFSTSSLVITGMALIYVYLIGRYSSGVVDWEAVYGISLLCFVSFFIWEMVELFIISSGHGELALSSSAIFQVLVIVILILTPEDAV